MFIKTQGISPYTDVHYDDDTSLWLWQQYGVRYYIASHLGLNVSIAGVGTCTTHMAYWKQDLPNYDYGVDWYLWPAYTATTASRVYYLTQVTTYNGGLGIRGDGWWTGQLNYGSNTFSAAGTATTSMIVTVEENDIWVNLTSFIGEYTGIGSKSGTSKWVGWRRFDATAGGQPDKVYWEKLTKYNNEAVFYTSSGDYYIWYDPDDTKWTISGEPGVKNSTLGYYESSTLTGTYSIVYAGGFPPSPSSWDIAVKDYKETDADGNTLQTCSYNGEISNWQDDPYP